MANKIKRSKSVNSKTGVKSGRKYNCGGKLKKN